MHFFGSESQSEKRVSAVKKHLFLLQKQMMKSDDELHKMAYNKLFFITKKVVNRTFS